MEIPILLLTLFIAKTGFEAARFDAQNYILPNRLIIQIFVAALMTQILNIRVEVINVSSLLFCVHLFTSLVSPNALGMGDVKLLAGLSLTLATGEMVFGWICLAYLMGAIHGIFRKLWLKSSRIPFGVSLYGAWAVISVGEWACVALDYSR